MKKLYSDLMGQIKNSMTTEGQIKYNLLICNKEQNLEISDKIYPSD